MSNSIMLFEETDNPYEKTFIAAKISGGCLFVRGETIDYDGCYALTYDLDRENTEKLTDILKTDCDNLLSRIASMFTGENADNRFALFCRSTGVEYRMYAC